MAKPRKAWRGHDATGRTKGDGKVTALPLALVQEPAWRALSPKAQMTYIWLRFEGRDRQFSNNGKIQLSVRQAAQRLGIHRNAAAGGFQELQQKGFVVVTAMAALGVTGEARGPSYELTEFPLPQASHPVGRRLYKAWKPGNDFEAVRHPANNPKGANGKNIPSRKAGRCCPEKEDG
ncbi:hypothetical protein [Maricaulis sp.]|uniref:hypothetical protein n=1 Tax=Maricaulis sp. TaxID=1486257 RepID=UPI003A8D945B